MIKVAEISPKRAPRMTVYYDKTAKRNPYRVYLEWMEPTPHGLVARKRQQSRFADFASAIWDMPKYALEHNEDRR